MRHETGGDEGFYSSVVDGINDEYDAMFQFPEWCACQKVMVFNWSTSAG